MLRHVKKDDLSEEELDELVLIALSEQKSGDGDVINIADFVRKNSHVTRTPAHARTQLMHTHTHTCMRVRTRPN
jgi:hypothetical protein